MGAYTFKGVTDVSIYENLNMLGQLNSHSVRQCVESMGIDNIVAITPNKWKERYDKSGKYAMHRELGATTPVKALVVQRPCENGVHSSLLFAINMMKKSNGLKEEPYKILEHFVANETPITLRLYLRNGNIDIDMATVDTSLKEDLSVLTLLRNKIASDRNWCGRIELSEVGVEGVIKLCVNGTNKTIRGRMFKQYTKAFREWLNIMIESTEKEINKQVI